MIVNRSGPTHTQSELRLECLTPNRADLSALQRVVDNVLTRHKDFEPVSVTEDDQHVGRAHVRVCAAKPCTDEVLSALGQEIALLSDWSIDLELELKNGVDAELKDIVRSSIEYKGGMWHVAKDETTIHVYSSDPRWKNRATLADAQDTIQAAMTAIDRYATVRCHFGSMPRIQIDAPCVPLEVPFAATIQKEVRLARLARQRAADASLDIWNLLAAEDLSSNAKAEGNALAQYKSTVEGHVRRILRRYPQVGTPKISWLGEHIATITLENDQNSIREPWLHGLLTRLGELQETHPEVQLRARLSLSEGTVLRIASEELGTLRPWRMNLDRELHSLRIELGEEEDPLKTFADAFVRNVRSELPDVNLAEARRRIGQRTGYHCELTETAPQKFALNENDFVILPLTPWIGTPVRQLEQELDDLRRRLPRALLIKQDGVYREGNRFVVEYHTAGLPPSTIERIASLFQGYALPIVFRAAQPETTICSTNVKAALESALALCELEGEIQTEDSSTFNVMVQGEADIAKSDATIDLRALSRRIELAVPYQVRLSQQEPDEASVFNVIANELGKRVRSGAHWELQRQDMRWVLRHNVGLTAPTLKKIVNSVEQRLGIVVAAEPHDFRLKTLVSLAEIPPHSGYRSLDHQELRKSLEMVREKLRPYHLTRSMVRFSGNRIQIRLPYQKIPPALVTHLKNYLGRYPTGIEITGYTRSFKPPRNRVTEEILWHCLPDGFYLAEAPTVSDNSAALKLWNCTEDLTQLNQWRDDFTQCIDRELKIECLKPSDRFGRVLKSSTRSFAHFMGVFCDKDGIVPTDLDRQRVQIMHSRLVRETPNTRGHEIGKFEIWRRCRPEPVIMVDPQHVRVKEDAQHGYAVPTKDETTRTLVSTHGIAADHVADIGGMLDSIAEQRQQSLFIPKHTLNMLPEEVLFRMASLHRGSEHPTHVVDILQEEGEILAWRVRPGIARPVAGVSDGLLADVTHGAAHRFADQLRLLDESFRQLGVEREALRIDLSRPDDPLQSVGGESSLLTGRLIAEYCRNNKIPIPYLAQDPPEPNACREILDYAQHLKLYSGELDLSVQQFRAELQKIVAKVRTKDLTQSRKRLFTCLRKLIPAAYYTTDPTKSHFLNGRMVCQATAMSRNNAARLVGAQLTRHFSGRPLIPEDEMQRRIEHLNQHRNSMATRRSEFATYHHIMDSIKHSRAARFNAKVSAVKRGDLVLNVTTDNREHKLSLDLGNVSQPIGQDSLILSSGDRAVSVCVGDRVQIQVAGYDVVNKRPVGRIVRLTARGSKG